MARRCPNLSPATPGLLSCTTSYRSKDTCMALSASSELGPNELPKRGPSIPTKFLQALAGKALTTGHMRLVVLLLVAFHAFLRTQPGKPFRARSTRRPSAAFSSCHQNRAAPPGCACSGGHQRCYCHRVHTRGGAQTSTRRKALATKRSIFF